MRRLPLLLVVLVVAAIGCGGDDGSSASSTTSTSRTESTTTSSAPAAPELGDAVALGDGTLVGIHPTASIVYVSIVDTETDRVGCEGGDVARLWAQPLDGGPRVRALPDSFLSGVVLAGGFDGRVAVVDQCEGFLSSLTIAKPDAQGRFTDVAEVDTAAAASDGQLQPGTLRWTADGSALLGIVRMNDAVERTIGVRISLDGTVRQLVEGDGYLAIGDLRDGSIVTATASHMSISGDTAVEVDLHVTSIAVSPDGDAVAVFGDGGIEIVAPHEGHRRLSADAASVGSWSPDGDLLTYLALGPHDASGVRVTRLAGGPEVVSERAGFGAPLFTADGRWIAYNDAVDSGKGFSEPRAAARPITS